MSNAPNPGRVSHTLKYPMNIGGEDREAGYKAELRPDQVARIKAYEAKMDQEKQGAAPQVEG